MLNIFNGYTCFVCWFCVTVCDCMYVCACWGQRRDRCPPSSLCLTLLRWGLSLHRKFTALDALTGQLPLVSISLPWETVTCDYPWLLHMSAEDSNSGPYACRESTLIPRAVSQIPRQFVLVVLSHLREAWLQALFRGVALGLRSHLHNRSCSSRQGQWSCKSK